MVFASGAKLNKSKSLGLYIGNWKICRVIYVELSGATWENVWGKFKNVIKLNKIRNLRLFGK